LTSTKNRYLPYVAKFLAKKFSQNITTHQYKMTIRRLSKSVQHPLFIIYHHNDKSGYFSSGNASNTTNFYIQLFYITPSSKVSSIEQLMINQTKFSFSFTKFNLLNIRFPVFFAVFVLLFFLKVSKQCTTENPVAKRVNFSIKKNFL
jgi:hypothetical protein